MASYATVHQTSRWAEFAELSALFFVQAAAMGAWFVPLGPVLDAHGFQSIKPLAFAASAVAAFISPLLFGAMADRHVAPVLVLRGLAIATAAAMVLAALAIGARASAWVVLACIQLHALCSAPTWGISSAIVLKRLSNPQRQFGPVRALGSLGWMVGCWVVSGLAADTSTLACYAAAGIWLLVAVLTLWLPEHPSTARDRASDDPATAGLGCARASEESRSSRRLPHHRALLDPARGLLSVHAHAHADASGWNAPAPG